LEDAKAEQGKEERDSPDTGELLRVKETKRTGPYLPGIKETRGGYVAKKFEGVRKKKCEGSQWGNCSRRGQPGLSGNIGK